MSAPTTLNSFASESSTPSLSQGSRQVPMEDRSLHALLSDLIDEHLKPNGEYWEVNITIDKDKGGKILCIIIAFPANAGKSVFGAPDAASDTDLAPAITRLLDMGETVTDVRSTCHLFKVKIQHNSLSELYTIKLTGDRKVAE